MFFRCTSISCTYPCQMKGGLLQRWLVTLLEFHSIFLSTFTFLVFTLTVLLIFIFRLTFSCFSFHFSVHFLSLPTSDISSKSQNKQSRSMVQLLSLHKVTLEEHIFNSNYIQGDFFNCPPPPKSSKYKKVNLGGVRCI